MSFFTPEDREQRRKVLGGSVDKKRERENYEACLKEAEKLLPIVLEQIRSDFRAGRTHSQVKFSPIQLRFKNPHEGAKSYAIAPILAQLIKQKTGCECEIFDPNVDAGGTDTTFHISLPRNLIPPLANARGSNYLDSC